ncbi:hypothetical protein AXG93_3911s1260 [Marchantia polymorpha subsp. ruderalis]|uniref:Uncharacterized protein n=1 Tax=Marchantia polymorpha subsp. ruderalis TaxID=1480154 RepID=A0A176W322_MARPO|nr:hypothetical protein AXG93_3911s1260 [Marchantia polymorpha subsp. ruderalis]
MAAPLVCGCWQYNRRSNCWTRSTMLDRSKEDAAGGWMLKRERERDSAQPSPASQVSQPVRASTRIGDSRKHSMQSATSYNCDFAAAGAAAHSFQAPGGAAGGVGPTVYRCLHMHASLPERWRNRKRKKLMHETDRSIRPPRQFWDSAAKMAASFLRQRGSGAMSFCLSACLSDSAALARSRKRERERVDCGGWVMMKVHAREAQELAEAP